MNITPMRWKILCTICLVIGLHQTGCRSGAPSGRPKVAATPAQAVPASGNQLTVFFFRNASYAGGGRTHILKIDDRAIGPLTAGNYYQLTMWSGEYQFSIYLPREEFFGQVSEPVTIGRQIVLDLHPDGNTYLLEYTDGLGSAGLAVRRIADVSGLIAGRTLDGSFSARDTAQVTHFFKASYDGPAYGGRPHGQGTLTWPDGSIYRGIFEHGIPTRKARFFFPAGEIYMGPNHRGRPIGPGLLMTAGRPIGPGLLMTAGGRILFAGGFENEKPSGRGIRDGVDGPEFCIYSEGRDITKTFRQLAKEALDVSDQELIRTRRDPEKEVQAKILFQEKRMAEMAARHDPDTLLDEYAKARKEIEQLEKTRRRLSLTKEADEAEFIAQLRASRYEREIAKEKEFHLLHQAKIEKERQWCRDEMRLGRNLCICAPLAEAFDTWQECLAPSRQRYIE